jgi:hypothetical protein
MVETKDYTKPEESISKGHSTEAQELMIKKSELSFGERMSKCGTRISIASIIAATTLAAGHFNYVGYRAKNAPEIVKEYWDIGPASKELSEAIEHSKKNYLFNFDRNNFRSEAVVSKLERVQLENVASQNEQLGNLSGLMERLEIRKREIEETRPEVAQYTARTDNISGYFNIGLITSVQMAGLGALMFSLPYIISHIKKRRKELKE